MTLTITQVLLDSGQPAAPQQTLWRATLPWDRLKLWEQGRDGPWRVPELREKEVTSLVTQHKLSWGQ